MKNLVKKVLEAKILFYFRMLYKIQATTDSYSNCMGTSILFALGLIALTWDWLPGSTARGLWFLFLFLYCFVVLGHLYRMTHTLHKQYTSIKERLTKDERDYFEKGDIRIALSEIIERTKKLDECTTQTQL